MKSSLPVTLVLCGILDLALFALVFDVIPLPIFLKEEFGLRCCEPAGLDLVSLPACILKPIKNKPTATIFSIFIILDLSFHLQLYHLDSLPLQR